MIWEKEPWKKKYFYTHEEIMGWNRFDYEIMSRERGSYYKHRKGMPWFPQWLLDVLAFLIFGMHFRPIAWGRGEFLAMARQRARERRARHER